jgi:hypothetical protein
MGVQAETSDAPEISTRRTREPHRERPPRQAPGTVRLRTLVRCKDGWQTVTVDVPESLGLLEEYTVHVRPADQLRRVLDTMRAILVWETQHR